MRKFNLIAMATAAMSLAAVGSAMAAPIAVFGTAGSGDANVSWSGTTLTVTDTAGSFVGKNGFFGTNSNLSGEVTSISFAGSTFTTSGSTFTETLGAGTFTTTGPGGTISGTIGAGDSFTGSLTGPAAFTFTGIPGDVTYNSTPLFNSSGLAYTGGDFSLEAIDVSPGTFTDGGVPLALNPFTAVDETTFSANVTSTPEPASVATFGIGALALVMMAAIARRRNAGAQL